MMSAQRIHGLLRLCAQWGRTLHPASVNRYKISRSSYSRQNVLLNRQLRSLCTKPYGQGDEEVASSEADDKDMDLGNVFKKIQQEAGLADQPSAPSQTLDSTEKGFLKGELQTLASDWKELALVLDGQDMSGSALLMFVEENITSAPYSVICKLVTSYSEVFDKESKQFQMVLDEGVRRMSDETLIQALFFVNALNQLPVDKVPAKYFMLCLEKIKIKFSSEISAVELVFALSILRRSRMPELQEMLDNMTIQHLPDMTTENVLDLFHIKALDRHRNPTLIRNIVTKLNRSDLTGLSLLQLSNLFYSCSTLSVYNQQLLQNVSEETAAVLRKQKYATPATAMSRHSILFSCKRLHWRDENLLKELARLLRSSLDKAKSKDVTEDIISLCHLGYNRPDVVNNFKTEGVRKNDLRWLQYVHATAAVQLAKLEDIQMVLDPSFYMPLLDQGEQFHTDNVKKMLLNLQGCLEVDFGIKNTPLREAEDWVNAMAFSRSKNSLAYAVEAALKYISSDIDGARFDKYGHRIDANSADPDQTPHFQCDDWSGSTLFAMSKDFEVLFRLSPSSNERVKAAIRVLEFNEMVQGGETGVMATGPSAMATRHLQAQNTPVLILPYYKWKRADMSIQNAARLETLLQEVVNIKGGSKKKQELEADQNQASAVSEANDDSVSVATGK